MLCECGCGEKTGIAKNGRSELGWIKGQPKKFIHGHNPFRGGKTIDSKGYIRVLSLDHPRAQSKGYIFEHRLIAEKILGKTLPKYARTHHYGLKDENKKIVLCQDDSYHSILHRRTRAYNACGHAYWQKCPFCKTWDDPVNMYVYGRHARHRQCLREYEIKRKQPKEGSV